MKTETVHGVPVRCYAQASGLDRFTVAFLGVAYTSKNPALVQCVGLSGHSGAMLGRHLGRRVPFRSLPAALRRVVVSDCREIRRTAAR